MAKIIGTYGNDSYNVDISNCSDLIIETSNGGHDIVSSSVSYTLGSNIEDLTLTGSSDLNGAGNRLGNIITGNTGNNVLSGSYGNDSLYGGYGNDTCIGGRGNDYISDTRGNDTYYIYRHDGNDNLTDKGGLSDEIKYGKRITVNDLIFSRKGSNYSDCDSLKISVKNTGDSVTIDHWYSFAYHTYNTHDNEITPAPDAPDKKIIELGVQRYSPLDLLSRISALDNTPVDGVAIEYPDLSRIFANSDTALGTAAYQTQTDALQQLSSTKLTDNFICLWTGISSSSNSLDWFNDTQWNNVLDKLGYLAQVADSSSTVKGFFFDPEQNRSVYNIWGFNNTNHPDKTYDDYKAKARQRGYDFLNKIQDNFTNPVIQTTYLMTAFDAYYSYGYTRNQVNNNIRYDGYPMFLSFVEGMLDAIRPGTVIYDGDESAYYYINAADYASSNDLIKNFSKDYIISPENADKYAEYVKTSHSISTDYIYNTEDMGMPLYTNYMTPDEVTKWLEYNVYYALNYSDKYVWLWNHKANLYNGTNIPSGMLEAMQEAKNKINNHEALGYSINDIMNRAVLECYYNYPENQYQNGYLGHNNYVNGNYRIENLLFKDGSSLSIPDMENNVVVVGSNSSESIVGYSYDDNIYGYKGNDTIDGEYGNDTLYGGKGNDVYTVNSRDDRIVEYKNQGNDTIYSNISYTLGNYTENLILTGTADITGKGNSGNNILTANSGNDTLIGGNGSDTYYVNNPDDLIIEYSNKGIDTVFSSANYTLGDYLEKLTLTGTADINGAGNLLSNTITGNTGNNALAGGAGNDRYIFNLNCGQDTISDISGKDRITFGTGISKSSIAIFKQGADLIIDYGDTVPSANHQIIIQNQFEGNSIEKFQLSNGRYLSNANINHIIQDIINYDTAHSEFTITSINDVKSNPELMNIIQSHWHA